MQKVRGSNPLGPTIFDERGRKINFLLFYFFHGIHLVGTVVPTVRVCDTKQKGNETPFPVAVEWITWYTFVSSRKCGTDDIVLIDDLRRYLDRLGLAFAPTAEAVDVGRLPAFMASSNEWLTAKLLGRPCVLALSKRRHETPDSVVITWKTARRVLGRRMLLVLEAADEEFCRVLECAGVAYAMPGKRIMIPDEVHVVTGDAPRAIRLPKERLTVNAQLALLWYLLKGKGDRVSFRELAEGPKLPKNRITDVAKELEIARLAAIDKAWKAHALEFSIGKRELWEKALPVMASPVQSRFRTKSPSRGLARAGILALSDQTMLAPDNFGTYAISRGDPRIGEMPPLRYEGDVIEVWKYAPARLAGESTCVDNLSLYLTLKDDPDERVRGELRTLLEGIEW